MDEFNLDLVRGDKARGSDVPTSAKEWTAFLVDCGDSMYRSYRGPLARLQGLTLFQAAMKQISDIIASRLAHGIDDDITIVLFNRGTPNVWHPGGMPTLALLERLDDLATSNAKDVVFGKSDERQGRSSSLVESLRNAMISAVLEFDTGEWSNYKVVISLVVVAFTSDNDTGTCDDDPCFGTIVELICRRNIKFHTVFLDDHKLDVQRQCMNDASTVWARLCLSEAAEDHNTRSIVANPFALPLSTRFVSHIDVLKMCRFGGTSKTTSVTVPWHLGSFGVVDMRVHSLTVAAWPRCTGGTKWLDILDSAVLITKPLGMGGRQTDDSTDFDPCGLGDPQGDLPDDGLAPYYPKPMGKKLSSAPRLVLTDKIVGSLKCPVPFRRLWLIGFKPRTWLDDAWQMRDTYFMRPDDDKLDVQSMQRCNALHNVMVEQSVIAVCGLIIKAQTEPRIVAVMPSTSKETGKALGFSVMELPFADDIRLPEYSDALGKPQHASAIGSKSAEKIVAMHRVTKSDLPGIAQHPHVQRHFAVLQSLLLDRPTLDDEEYGAKIVGGAMSRDCQLAYEEFKRLHNL